MAGKVPDVPFGYGNLITVTQGKSGSVLLWFVDHSGTIRGVPVETGDGELVIKRRTEGQARRKRGVLPPVAASAPTEPTK